MDGVIFYFLMWFWVIIFAFIIYRKWKYRKCMLVFFLCVIISSGLHIRVFDLTITVTYLLLLLASVWYLILKMGEKWKCVNLLSFCIALAYGGYRLMELYDPVWFFHYPLVMVSVLLMCSGVWLGKTYDIQLIIIVLGVLQGEVLLALLLHPYGFFNDVLSLKVLDCLALVCTLLSILHVIVFYLSRFKKMVKKRKETI